MTRKLYRFALFAAAVMASTVLVAGEEILYWMVDDSASITINSPGSPSTTATIGDYFDSIGGEASDFAARVRVTGGNIQDGQDVFLDLYVPGYGIVAGSGEYGVEFGDGSGYWGAGVPTGNQSPSGDYSAGTPEYSFIVELGNIDSSDNWTTVATSASASYSSLGDYIHQTFDVNPGQIAVWTPTEFSAVVPEPSSGLLTVIGLALLALRRRRFSEGA